MQQFNFMKSGTCEAELHIFWTTRNQSIQPSTWTEWHHICRLYRKTEIFQEICFAIIKKVKAFFVVLLKLNYCAWQNIYQQFYRLRCLK